MEKITQGLKHTLVTNPHIEQVHFDKFGNHHFHAHKHEKTGDLYTKIKSHTQTVAGVDANNRPYTKKEKVYEASPNDVIVKTMTSTEVLATPVENDPVFSDADTKAIYEKQASENAKLRAELEDLKNANPASPDTSELDALKAELEQAKKDKAELEDLINSPDENKETK